MTCSHLLSVLILPLYYPHSLCFRQIGSSFCYCNKPSSRPLDMLFPLSKVAFLLFRYKTTYFIKSSLFIISEHWEGREQVCISCLFFHTHIQNNVSTH